MEAEKLDPAPETTGDGGKDVVVETEVEKVPEKKVSDSKKHADPPIPEPSKTLPM